MPAAPANGLSVYGGPFGIDQAERLLWRAGFGPSPGQAQALAGQGLTAAVQSLTRPSGDAHPVGPEPTVDGAPLDPADHPGDEHLWWLDRMVRSDQPLVERMALIWHDWFATSNAGRVNDIPLMLAQNDLFRTHALGSFSDLFRAVTIDDAMLIWLNGAFNTKNGPDENYGREMMELFTLGANRGAYTEDDVREMARSLTGWATGGRIQHEWRGFSWQPSRHDDGQKTVFGQTGSFDWQDACRLCLEHPLHASFFVSKLWGYFVPTDPSPRTLQDLSTLYVSNDHAIGPVVEAILMHPDFYLCGPMVKPPVVLCAGLMRAQRLGITDGIWVFLGNQTGQRLFFPPDVGGWNDDEWLSTQTVRGRWLAAHTALRDRWIDPWNTSYDAGEDAETALRRALSFWGDPPLTRTTWDVLMSFSSTCIPPLKSLSPSSAGPYRAMRQNALRQLIPSAPDYQVS